VANDIIYPVEICHLYISAGHNYVGHHGREPDEFAMIEVPAVECVAGHGLVGDRYFGHTENYKGQITFFSLDVFDELCGALEVRSVCRSCVRRNVFTRNADLNGLIGKDFEIQGIQFHGTEESRPCYWMDRAIAPGAQEFLRGRGGLRARILTDGILRSSLRVTATTE
jgi:MOSC domain-containing protein YiiM